MLWDVIVAPLLLPGPARLFERTRPGRARLLTMAAVLIRPNARKSRLRLFVLQALVLSLFLTLFARLWYIQILTGEGYRAQAAASRSARSSSSPPAA